jgi:hypothetical protein
VLEPLGAARLNEGLLDKNGRRKERKKKEKKKERKNAKQELFN